MRSAPRTLLLATAAALAAALLAAAPSELVATDAGGAEAPPPARKPNLLIIQTDEHNFRTLGCYRDTRYLFNRGHWKQFELGEDGPQVKARNAKGKPSYDVAGADEQSFATDWLADRAIDFIAEHAGQPFCFMLSLPDPHGPDTVRPPYDTMYAGLEDAPPPSFAITPEQAPAWAQPQGRFQPMSRYFGMVKCIDDNVGRILAALEERGLREDTVVVFTSDHGDLRGEHHRQNKGVPFEASAKIPFVVRAPGLLPAGGRVDAALGTVDFLPTMMALMEVPTAGLEQGRDASALLRGETKDDWQDVTFLRQAGRKGEGWLAAVSDGHKLVVAPDERPWLIDLDQDPHELVNALDGLPEGAAPPAAAGGLARALLRYAEEIGDPYAEHPKVRAELEALAAE